MFKRNTKGSGPEDATDSIQAMLAEAERQGWLPGRSLGFIPEIMNIYQQASAFFFNFLGEQEPEWRETFVYHTCRYLFAKGVEGVILWGPAPGGRISVYFHPKHLVGEFETEVPKNLHQLVVDSMDIGESLFKAHQQWVISQQQRGLDVDLGEEIRKTIEWIPRFGISYALHKKYQALIPE